MSTTENQASTEQVNALMTAAQQAIEKADTAAQAATDVVAALKEKGAEFGMTMPDEYWSKMGDTVVNTLKGIGAIVEDGENEPDPTLPTPDPAGPTPDPAVPAVEPAKTFAQRFLGL